MASDEAFDSLLAFTLGFCLGLIFRMGLTVSLLVGVIFAMGVGPALYHLTTKP